MHPCRCSRFGRNWLSTCSKGATLLRRISANWPVSRVRSWFRFINISIRKRLRSESGTRECFERAAGDDKILYPFHRITPNSYRFLPPYHRITPNSHRFLPPYHRFLPPYHRFTPNYRCNQLFYRQNLSVKALKALKDLKGLNFKNTPTFFVFFRWCQHQNQRPKTKNRKI